MMVPSWNRYKTRQVLKYGAPEPRVSGFAKEILRFGCGMARLAFFWLRTCGEVV